MLTRELAEYTQWGEAEIESRGCKLGAEACQIWIRPKEPVPAPPPPGEEETAGRQEVRMQFWTGLNEFLASEYPALPRIDPRPDWRIRLSSGLRHVGFELRFNLKHDIVGIDVWFWRAASRPVWERIRIAPLEYDGLIGETWKFEPAQGERARMFIDRQVSELRTDVMWPELYRWFGAKLTTLYAEIAPRLRQALDQSDTSPATT